MRKTKEIKMANPNEKEINSSNITNRFLKIYPWLASLSGDLIFFIAIDSLFLRAVVGLTNSQIILSTSIALIIRLIIQPLLLFIIKKIGNTLSVRLGLILLTLSMIFYTFGKSFLAIIIAKLLFFVAYVFRDMINVILKNNLEAQNRQDEFKKYRNKETTIYSIVTMILLIVVTLLFNINPYIPMGCGIALTIFCFIFSLFISEEKPQNLDESIISYQKKTTFFSFGKIILLAIISYGLFYAIMASSQDNGKLFIQDILLDSKSVEKTALILGVIQYITRITRILSNIFFPFLSKKLGSKFGCVLTALLLFF